MVCFLSARVVYFFSALDSCMLGNAITAWIGDVIHHLNARNIALAQLRGQMLQTDLEKLLRAGGAIAEIDRDSIAELKFRVERGLLDLRTGNDLNFAIEHLQGAQQYW